MEQVLELLDKMQLERENTEYKQPLIKAIELTMIKCLRMEVEKLENIPHERVVKPTLAEDTVEIHLNYSTDETLRIFGWTPYGEREELDILMGEMVIAHHDHYEVDKAALYRILTKLLQNGQKYIISGH